MDKQSFIIYKNWAEIIKRLPVEDAGELIQAICCYVTDDDVEIFNPYLDAIFEGQIKPQLIDDAVKYALEIEKRSEAGKKGMKNRWNNVTNNNTVITKHNTDITANNTTITNITDTVTVTDTVTDNNKRVRAVFKPPSLEEVKAYCQERHNDIDPEAFISFYESKGWMVGKNKMKDWKACIRTWEKRKAPEKNKYTNFEERVIDFDDLEKRFAKN